MTEVVVSYSSNTYVPIVSNTVDQSFFHTQTVPILGPNISENRKNFGEHCVLLQCEYTCMQIFIFDETNTILNQKLFFYTVFRCISLQNE